MSEPGILGTMARLEEAGHPFVCVTMAATRGSAPQDAGAKMVVTLEGRAAGTVGGGRVEEAAIKHACALLARNGSHNEMVEWNLQRDIGMTCGGVVTLLFETFNHALWQIAIFGAGHVSQSLVRTLSTLNCRITVFDTRRDWLEKLPAARNVSAIYREPLENAVADIPEGAFVALMTQGHRTDRPVLERILQTRKFPYLGVIGSKSKAATLRKELRENGVSEKLLQAFRCPLGLPLGSDSPEEIAISIAAEMLQVRGA